MERIIVAFHIGRGGRFFNGGHKSFIGEKKIGDFTNDLFVKYENISDIQDKIAGRENLENLFDIAQEDSEAGNNARTRFEKCGFKFGELVYTDCNGNKVGLSVSEAENGIGSINIDNDYDTTYTCYIEDCDELELKLINESVDYKSIQLDAWMEENYK